MTSCDEILDRGGTLVLRAWRTLGLPLNLDPLAERESGLIDPEAALVLALLQKRPHPRLASDVPSWLHHYGDLINRQKLRTMLRSLPATQARLAADCVARWPSQNPAVRYIHASLQRAGLDRGGKRPRLAEAALPSDAPPPIARLASARRVGVIAQRDTVARSCLLVHNRLLYGTGFRADCVSVLATRRPPTGVTSFARLLGTNASTISRILADLRACGYIDHRLRVQWRCSPAAKTPAADYPGVLISSEVIGTWCELLDAAAMDSATLRQAFIEDLDRAADPFWALVRAKQDY